MILIGNPCVNKLTDEQCSELWDDAVNNVDGVYNMIRYIHKEALRTGYKMGLDAASTENIEKLFHEASKKYGW